MWGVGGTEIPTKARVNHPMTLKRRHKKKIPVHCTCLACLQTYYKLVYIQTNSFTSCERHRNRATPLMSKGSKKRKGKPSNQSYVFQILLMTFLSLCIFLVVFFVVQLTDVHASDGYLYNPGSSSDEKETEPILEYVKPDKIIGETDEDYEDRSSYAPFLSANVSAPRIVEFYSPWCGHCKHYKPKYIQLARDVNKVAPLEFHAVSCTVHSKICKDQNVHGYPTVKWFPGTTGHEHHHNNSANSDSDLEPVVLPHGFTASQILKDYLHVDAPQRKDTTSSNQVAEDSWKKMKSAVGIAKAKKAIANKLSPHKNNNKRNRVFHDAARSFDFALRNAIFMSNDALDETKSKTFQKWLELLSKSIPENMKTVRDDVESITLHFDTAVQSEESLLQYLGHHEDRDRDHDHGAAYNKSIIRILDKEWSDNCSKGETGQGYTCGLWELFHVITIGCVQWNTIAPREDMRIATTDAADMLRDYIEHFFACDECRKNFLTMYDACQFQRCDRLTSDVSDAAKAQGDWKQLPLWLWETHNDVNVRLMGENRKEAGLSKATLEQEQEARWPSNFQCGTCWLDGGGWNEEEVYKYLRSHYWHFDPLGEEGMHAMLREGVGGRAKEHANGAGAVSEKVKLKRTMALAIGFVFASSNPFVAASWAALLVIAGYFLYNQRRKRKSNAGKCE
jgi:thiol oxidase